MVGDGDAVGIAAEILQDVLGSAEGRFGVDDPVFAEERTQPSREELGMGKRCEFSGQVQLTAFEGRLQTGDELATKHAPQYSNGKEEAWMGSNPAHRGTRARRHAARPTRRTAHWTSSARPRS